MRALAFLKKTFLENVREWKILSFTLVFAPAFVYLMHGYFRAAPPSYTMLVLNHDGEAGAAGLIATWKGARHRSGDPMLVVQEVTEREAALQRIRERDAQLLVEIPAGFSRKLAAFRAGKSRAAAHLANFGDESYIRSSMAMAYSDYIAFGYLSVVTDTPSPLEVSFERVGGRKAPTDFDLYVPALLVLAIIMVLFTAAATLLKEVDKRTIARLMLSRLTTTEMLAAVTVNQVAIGVVAMLLAYLAALSVGYRSDGSLLAMVAVGAVSTLGVVAISVLVAALLRTIYELLTVGTFPFFILMFFSECMFPLPKVALLHVAGKVLYLNDVLPTSLSVRALNKILNHGAGLGDVSFELGVIVLLTAAYFGLGTRLYRRRHMRV